MGENKNGSGIGVGLAIGMSIGVALWMLTGNIALLGGGLAISLGFGTAYDAWSSSKGGSESLPPEGPNRDDDPTG